MSINFEILLVVMFRNQLSALCVSKSIMPRTNKKMKTYMLFPFKCKKKCLHLLTESGPGHIQHINPSLLLDGCILLF